MDELQVGHSTTLGKRKYRVCPHCKCELTYKKFKEHKSFFYNDSTKVWAVDEPDIDTSDFSDMF